MLFQLSAVNVLPIAFISRVPGSSKNIWFILAGFLDGFKDFEPAVAEFEEASQAISAADRLLREGSGWKDVVGAFPAEGVYGEGLEVEGKRAFGAFTACDAFIGAWLKAEEADGVLLAGDGYGVVVEDKGVAAGGGFGAGWGVEVGVLPAGDGLGVVVLGGEGATDVLSAGLELFKERCKNIENNQSNNTAFSKIYHSYFEEQTFAWSLLEGIRFRQSPYSNSNSLADEIWLRP
jgi:hypothetical protein